MTQQMSDSQQIASTEESGGASPKFSRLFLTILSTLMFGMLLGSIFIATSYEKGDGLTSYERDAIEVVAMQNEITDGWNTMVDTFNTWTVVTPEDHVELYTMSQDTARTLISDSQAVINRWQAIDVPEEHLVSHDLGLQALRMTQDGLILFDEFFDNAVKTLVADQIRSEEAATKLVQAHELWAQAAEAAAREG